MKCDELEIKYVGYGMGFYPTEEVDEAIAELKKEKEYTITQTAEVINAQDETIDELKERIDELQKATDSAWGKVNTMYDELRHNKYKRCLAMAKWCEEAYNRECGLNPEEMTNKEFYKQQTEFLYRWNSKWLKISEQFKEAK